VRSALDGLLRQEHYDVVFTLLPRGDVHAHHRMAAVILLEAVAALPEASRPVVLGAEPCRAGGRPLPFPGLEESPLTRTIEHTPAFAFDRNTRFGHDGALNYHIVVNWVIAEHKSQGLFQTHCGKYDIEQFWAFAIGAPPDRIPELARRLQPPADAPAIYQGGRYPASI
jgi:hypothetical protein